MRKRALLVFGCVLAAGCGSRSVGTWPEAPVVLISIDTLRADHLGLYGYARGSTPQLDRLGREGVVFEDVYSHCPLTLPAHASLLTGLLPQRHGVRDNVGFTLGKPVTLAERFKAAGAPTGGAISAFVLRRQTGINKGFDFYEDELDIQGGTEALGALQRDGAVAVESLARWVEGRAGARLFAFLHLYEPHTPYAPPERYAHLASLYDGEIAYADELVGRFLDRLKARGLYQRAVIAVTGDHGEGLMDHQEAEHGIFLYREALHVPLILRLPGGARGGTRVAGPVAQVDIPATLLDLAGLHAEGLDGVSLRAAIQTGSAASRPVYSETLFPRYHFGWSELHAVTEGRFRFIKAPRPELYDLTSDPGERTNLAQSRAPAVAAMDAWLGRQVELGKLDAPEEVTSETREKLQALGYVGVASAAPIQGELPDPKDRIASYEDLKRAQSLRHQGKDAEAVVAFRKVVADNPRMLDAWELLGTTLVRMGRFAEGTAALVEALKLDPERSTTHIALVRAYVLQGRHELARQHAEIAATHNPAEGYETLAQLMLDVRQPERAAEYARKSLAADPQRTMSHWVLGTVARQAGRYEEAIASFRRVEESKKHHKTARVMNLYADIGDCLARLGRLEEAEQALLTELGLSPRSQEGRLRLAMLYRSQARDAEARQVLAGLIAAEPQPGADTYWTVVRAFGVLGDVEAARSYATKARALFPGDPRFRGAGG